MRDLFDDIEAIRARLGSRVCIMGHHYQNDNIIRHCDVTGDSLELSRKVDGIDAEYIVFCGVSFMGESAALLAKPGQKVLLPAPDAHCRMALMSRATAVRAVLTQLWERGLEFLPLAYVNTDVPLKAVIAQFGGSVCTSANAPAMMRWAFERSRHVIFIPDKHLGRNTAKPMGLSRDDWHILRIGRDGIVAPESQPLDRPLLLWPGYCPLHDDFTTDMVTDMRKAHPGCRVVIHPEAAPEVVDLCDGYGSTSYLIKEAARWAAEGRKETLVVGTEICLTRRLVERHKEQCRIVPLWEGPEAICPNMARTTPQLLLACLESIEKGSTTPVRLNEADIEPARLSLTRMLEACR